MANVIVFDQAPVFFDFINHKLQNNFSCDNSRLISHVYVEDNSYKILAVIAYHSWMKYSVEMSIAAEPSQWATKGYIQAAYDYPFFQMNREKVIATVLTDNSKSIEMLTRLGHTNEGCLKDYQGVDKDCYIYGITKRQYLAGKYVPKQRQEQYECNK